MEIFETGRPHYYRCGSVWQQYPAFDHVNEKNGLTFSHIDCTKEDSEAYIQGRIQRQST